MRKSVRLVIAAVAALGPAACADTSRNYSPPALGADAVAILTGSKIVNPDPTTPDTRVYLVAVDGKLVLLGAYGWDAETIVAPGPREIEFGVAKKGVLKDAWAIGRTRATFEPGRKYVLRASEPVVVSSVCARANAWIEGDDGKPLTERVPVVIATYSGMTIPVPGGGFANIPSRARCPPP
jgi:hypothetical protein